MVLEDFHIRKGSGGRGKWSAGDGTQRTIRARERLDFAILSGHRRVRPSPCGCGSLRAPPGSASPGFPGR
ncbi:hydantoinase B/oxoprolinase family protein [Sinorhizobium meliloti]|uniref:hydantoinase B/oxoprolinase family protein n=1 Tax=Rhizobium meliloti TaxID=382 RepID=UPI00399A3F68